MKRCLLTSLGWAFLTSACTGINPTLDTAVAMWGNAAPTAFSKGFEYLDVSVKGHRTVMALGSRQSKDGSVVEQWFSGQGEMLELRDGRVQRMLGSTREVRQSSAPSHRWAEWETNRSDKTWQRVREVMPGYQIRQEQVVSTALPTPGVATGAPEAVWVEEKVTTRLIDGRSWQYKDRFALVNGKVVFSEQCISPDLCLSLKPLGVVNP